MERTIVGCIAKRFSKTFLKSSNCFNSETLYFTTSSHRCRSDERDNNKIAAYQGQSSKPNLSNHFIQDLFFCFSLHNTPHTTAQPDCRCSFGRTSFWKAYFNSTQLHTRHKRFYCTKKIIKNKMVSYLIFCL